MADFDAVLRDPSDPARLRPAYDSGDHLHPNDAGYQAIADSIQPWVLALLAWARSNAPFGITRDRTLSGGIALAEGCIRS